MQILVNRFNDHDSATLDVTHGLRHLPMLVQQSALLLQSLKHVTIHGIYYGALDLTQAGITPVMQLSGLLEIDRWAQALDSYGKDGDYSVFVALLLESGFSYQTIDHLKNAAFYEQTNRIDQATGEIRRFLKMLMQEKQHCSVNALLFLPELDRHFDWVHRKGLYNRQAAVARLALQHGNLIRAAIYGFEAFVTSLVQQERGKPESFNDRKQAKDNYEARRPSASWNSYRLLRDIRNQLAHSSTAPTAPVQSAVSSREKLTVTLSVIFEDLLSG